MTYGFRDKAELGDFITPVDALERRFGLMGDQVVVRGCSDPIEAPVNMELVRAYKDFGDDDPDLDTLMNYDLIKAIPDALKRVIGSTANITEYRRTFSPGIGEGLHPDPHNIVVTATHDGKADFTIDTDPPQSHELGRNKIIMYQGTTPHTVSAPHDNKSRTITAWGIDT